MNMIKLRNPSESDIIDYPIEEIEFDQLGNPMLDLDKKPKKTGRTLDWSLKAGEELKFPEYVADYLRGIYGFLEVVKTDMPTEILEPQAKPVEGGVNCQICGKTVKGAKGIALHFATAHSDELLKRLG